MQVFIGPAVSRLPIVARLVNNVSPVLNMWGCCFRPPCAAWDVPQLVSGCKRAFVYFTQQLPGEAVEEDGGAGGEGGPLFEHSHSLLLIMHAIAQVTKAIQEGAAAALRICRRCRKTCNVAACTSSLSCCVSVLQSQQPAPSNLSGRKPTPVLLEYPTPPPGRRRTHQARHQDIAEDGPAHQQGGVCHADARVEGGQPGAVGWGV